MHSIQPYLSRTTELRQCEEVITRGWGTFLAVGRALQHVKQAQLYRYRYRSFEEYCRHKWHYTRTHAYRLIGAAQLLNELSPIDDTPTPTHESQVRPLLALDPKIAPAAWLRAAELAGDQPITAKLVRRAVNELTNATSRPRRGGESRRQTGEIVDAILGILDDLKKHSSF